MVYKRPRPNAERDRNIVADYVLGGTQKSVGQKYGISPARVGHIVEKQKRLFRGWLNMPFKGRKHNPKGVLIDPDGIDAGELQEWTPEQQRKEFEVSYER